MSLRMPVIAAVAVVLASLSLNAVLQGNGWLAGGIGAAIVVAAAGLGSRMPGARFPVTAGLVALICAVPLLFWPRWPELVAGLALIGLTAASATGYRPLRGFATLALYLGALLIYLNLAFAASHSYARVLPSRGSMAYLGHLVGVAFTQFRASPPLADTRAVSLVASCGIGLVAVLVDLLAVRMERPALAGLPLLVLFSVPVASDLKTFSPIQVLTFAAGMAGYLTLLSTAGRERLRMWGRLVTFRHVQAPDEAGSGPDTRQLAASGRRVGLVAVCLAIIIPIVLPAVPAHDIFGPTPAGTGAGAGGDSGASNAGAQLDALLQVQQQLQEKTPRPVLTYTTSAPAPADQYFQVYVLNYNARSGTWLPQFTEDPTDQRNSADFKLPYAPQGQLPSTPVDDVRTTVTLNKDQSTSGVAGFLPVPYAPVKLSTNTLGWAELPTSLMLFNSAEPLGGLQYTVVSSEPDPTPAEIEDASGAIPTSIIAEYGSYAGPDNARLSAIAHQHTVGAASELQYALDLQSWFTSASFLYTLKPGLPASNWLVPFLTTDRRGYCQQFAWAFAILARLLGIPSRVVIGYTGGTPGAHDTWVVTTADAHAWPELYFPGEGWLRFEPTPHGVGGQGTATAPPYATGSAGGQASTKPGTAGRAGAAAAAHSTTAPGGTRLSRGQLGDTATLTPVSGSGIWLVVGIPVLALLALGCPMVARRVTRRRRWLAASTDDAVAAAAWRELTDDLTDYGFSRTAGDTPRALARRIGTEAHLDPAAGQALRRIVTAAERAQYARLAAPAPGLAGDVLTVRRAMAASVPVRRRIRAWLLPASTLLAAQRVLQRAGDTLSWLDTSLPALRRQLRRAE